MSMGESLDSAPDRYDPTMYIQLLQFKLRCYEASGDDFQRLFEDIMERARPGFVRIRPYGNIGDRKCDGFLPADGTIFQRRILSVNFCKRLKTMRDSSTSDCFTLSSQLS